MTLDATAPLLAGSAPPSAWSGAAAPRRPLRPVPAAHLVMVLGLPPWPELAAALAPDGVRLLWLADVAAALDAARLAHFDAVVISSRSVDAAPGLALTRLKSILGCPLLACAAPGSARLEDDDIAWLDRGADGWVHAPATPHRLRAHLLALLRSHSIARTAPTPAPAGHCAWQVDLVRNRLSCGTQPAIALTEAQAALLHCLIEAQGRVVPRARLAQALMPSHGHALKARSIDVYVHRLRSRLRAAGVRDHDIAAVRGRGYCVSSTSVGATDAGPRLV